MKQNNKPGKRSKASKMPVKPPQIDATIQFGQTLRFRCTTSGTYIVTRGSLLDTLVMASSTTVAYRLLNGVKLGRVRIWSNPPGVAGAAPQEVAVQWLSQQGPTRVVSDNGIGSTFGARLDTKPPSGSLASFWSLTGTAESTPLFGIKVNAGDIIDIGVTGVFQNGIIDADGIENPASVTVVGATVGTVYRLALDFDTDTAGSTLVPVDYLTIT